MPGKRLTAFVTGLGSVGVAVLCLVVLGSAPSAHGDETHVAPALQSAFSLLSDTTSSTAVQPGSDLSARLARLDPTATAQYGLNFGAARQVQRGPLTVSVVPGSGGICLLTTETIASGQDAGLGVTVPRCASTTDTLAGGLEDSLYSSNAATNTSSGVVVALVPDGNSAVTVIGDTAPSQAVPVGNNVAVTTLPQTTGGLGAVSLTFKSASGNAVSYTQQPPAETR